MGKIIVMFNDIKKIKILMHQVYETGLLKNDVFKAQHVCFQPLSRTFLYNHGAFLLQFIG
jgi:hypothetical protein